jgi:hypothetical protein
MHRKRPVKQAAFQMPATNVRVVEKRVVGGGGCAFGAHPNA